MRNLIYYSLTLLLLLMTGCRSDEPEPWEPNDGTTTLQLLIPSTAMSRAETRAHGTHDILEQEGRISKLTVIGFYTDRKDRRHHFFAELDEDMGTPVEGIYRKYAMTVVPGDYDLYVLGNVTLGTSLKGQLQSASPTESEETLERQVSGLANAYSVNGQIDVPRLEAGLPMAWHGSASVAEGKTKTITATMGFTCAKVRLTIIYDKAYGDELFKINGVNAENIYTTAKFFPADDENATGSVKTTLIENVASALGHYDIGSLADMTLEELGQIPAKDDPIDNLGKEIDASAGLTSFAWQSVVYLPECVGKPEEERTRLVVKPSGDHDDYIFQLGCEDDLSTDHNQNISGPSLKRGHFYDLIARVAEDGEVTLYWDVIPWTVENISLQLSGNTQLYVNKTLIESIDGQETQYVDYTSSAPRLTFESSKFEDKDVFLLSCNTETKQIEVKVNPELGFREDAIKDQYFWVYAGNIKKKIKVGEVNLKPFLRLLPVRQTIYISEIVNEPVAELYFEYATNVDGLKLELSSYSNSNTKKGIEGISIEVCTLDSVTFTNRMQLDAAKVLTAEPALTGKEWSRKGGLIRITITDPTQSDYFSKQISGTFTASLAGDEVSPATAEFTIEPNATVYTIHFKCIDGANNNQIITDGKYHSDDKNYTCPHIYVYQPLEYNGYPVFEDYSTNQDGSLKTGDTNWLEYSFTGKISFKGWKKDRGEIDNMTSDKFETTISQGGNQNISGYRAGWGQAGAIHSGWDSKYDMNANLLGDTHYRLQACESCKTGGWQLWPGVGMIEEGNGWYKIDLPLLAKPGKALVMFAGYHNIGTSDKSRYPDNVGGNKPGVALPNYANKEAWFLLDVAKGGDNCSFSDYERNYYPDDSEYYAFVWPQYQNVFSQNRNMNNAYIYNYETEENFGATWDNCGAEGEFTYNNTAYYYRLIKVSSNLTNTLSSGNLRYIFNGSNGQSVGSNQEGHSGYHDLTGDLLNTLKNDKPGKDIKKVYKIAVSL